MPQGPRFGPTDEPRIIGFSVSTVAASPADQVITVMLDRRPSDAWIRTFNGRWTELTTGSDFKEMRVIGSSLSVLGTVECLNMAPARLQSLVKSVTERLESEIDVAHCCVAARSTSEAGDIREIEVEQIGQHPEVKRMLARVLELTGLRFAAVARVTELRWTALAVIDRASFGLMPGQDMILEKTLCNEVRQRGEPVVFSHASTDAHYASHPLPRLYGFESHLSVPIKLRDGTFFGTLCALDPEPTPLSSQMIAQVRALAQQIGTAMSEAPWAA
jgi:hypothetical protein